MKHNHLMLRRAAAITAVLATTVLAATPAAAAPLTDTFESYAAGSFPAPAWSDFASFYPALPSYLPPLLPSMTVQATTDAFGNGTQALQGADGGAGPARGVYALQASSSTLSLAADVRIVRYANTDAGAAVSADVAVEVGMFNADPSNAPFLSIYASSQSHGWRLSYTGDAAISADADDYDLGAAALPGVWYHVALELDRQSGSFHSRITDIASGTLLVDSVIGHANWLPGSDNFNGIYLASYENAAQLPWGPGSTTVSNLAQFDNVNYAAVPEPQTWLLMVVGLCAIARTRSRTRRA
jgi:hypothetical protein